MSKGFEDADYTHFFTCSQSQCRGHQYKLYKPYVKLDARKFFCSVRVVDVWNSLPEELLQCRTLQTFKRHLDLCLYNSGYT